MRSRNPSRSTVAEGWKPAWRYMAPNPPAPDMKRLMTLHVNGVGWERVSARLCSTHGPRPAADSWRRRRRRRLHDVLADLDPIERGNRARLEHVQFPAVERPFDILRRAEVVDGPPPQLPEAIHVAAVETGLLAGWSIVPPIPIRAAALSWLPAIVAASTRPVCPIHAERVGLDLAGDDRLAQSHAGLDKHLALAAAVRIAGKEHAGDVGRHEPLHHHGHSHARGINFVLAKIGQGPCGIEACPALPHRVEKVRLALNVQKRLVLSRHGGAGAVFRGCRRANRHPPATHSMVGPADFVGHRAGNDVCELPVRRLRPGQSERPAW